MPPPIACQLGVFDESELGRYRMSRSKVEGYVVRIEELPDGARIVLPGNDEMLALVTEWIALERRCCPFLSFTISVSGADTEMGVAITGDEEVKRFLDGEFASGSRKPRELVSLRRRK